MSFEFDNSSGKNNFPRPPANASTKKPEVIAAESQAVADPAGFFQQMLVDAVAFCETVGDKTVKTAAQFRDLNLREAGFQLNFLLEDVQLLTVYIQKLAQYSNCHFSELNFGEALFRHIMDMGQILIQCGRVQQKGDWVTLADMLEFKIIELLEQLLETIDGQWILLNSRNSGR